MGAISPLSPTFVVIKRYTKLQAVKMSAREFEFNNILTLLTLRCDEPPVKVFLVGNI